MRLAVFAVLAASPAAAEIRTSDATSFELEHRAVVPASPAEVYAQIGRIGEWWNVEHSYSGKAENLSLELRAGACFCERLEDGGSVEHLRVVYAAPGSAIRLVGGLGPLQQQAVSGTFSWTLKPVPGGTELVQNYVVAGRLSGGAEAWAPTVDQVLGQQFDRLRQKLGG